MQTDQQNIESHTRKGKHVNHKRLIYVGYLLISYFQIVHCVIVCPENFKLLKPQTQKLIFGQFWDAHKQYTPVHLGVKLRQGVRSKADFPISNK